MNVLATWQSESKRGDKKKKKSQSGETAEQTKERLHPDAIATASLHEKQEEGGESNAEKQEAFPFPGHKAALVRTGNFPSKSQAVLESWREVVPRDKPGDLEISQHQAKSQTALLVSGVQN